MSAEQPTSRLRRHATGVLRALGLGLVFVVALAVGAILHLGLAATRRLTTAGVNAALAGSFRGQVEVRDLELLSFGGARFGRLTARAPDGTEVLHLDGVELELSEIGQTLRALRAGELRVPALRIESARVSLERDADGVLLLGAAFAPPEPEPEPEPTEPEEPPARPLSVELERVTVAELRIDGTLPAGAAVAARLSDVTLSARFVDGTVAVELEHAALVEDRLLPAAIAANLAGSLRAPPLVVEGDVEGSVGTLAFSAHGRVEGESVWLAVRAPRIEPSAFEPFLPSVPRFALGSAGVDLRGTTRRLWLDGSASLAGLGGRAPSVASVAGAVDLTAEPTFELRATVSHFDARAVEPGLPETDLAASAQARGTVGGDIEVAVRTAPSRLAGLPLPGAEGEAHLSGREVTARLRFVSPGDDAARGAPPLQGTAALELRDGELEARALCDVPRIEALARLVPGVAPGLRGRARARARATLRAGALHAEARVEVAELVRGPWRAFGGKLDASFDKPAGVPLAEARGRATLALAGASAGAVALRNLWASAEGSAAELRFALHGDDGDERRFDVSGTLVPAELEARGLSVRLRRFDAELAGRIARIAPAGRGVRLDGVSLAGLGRGIVTGSLAIADGEPRGRLVAIDLDLGPLGKLLGSPQTLRGLVSAEAVFDAARAAHLHVGVTGGSVLVLSGLEGGLDVTRTGDEVRAEGRLTLGPTSRNPDDPCGKSIGAVRVADLRATLGGPLFDPASYRDVPLAGSVALDGLELRCFETVAALALPVRRLAGRLSAALELARPRGARYPHAPRLSLHTENLDVDVGDDDRGDIAASDRLDLALDGGLAADGAYALALEARARSGASAPLARLEAHGTLALERLFAGGATVLEMLRHTPLAVALRTGRQQAAAVAALSPAWRSALPALDGELEAAAAVTGTFVAPRATLELHASQLRLVSADGPTGALLAAPLDLRFAGSYEHGHGTGEGSFSRGERRVGTLATSLSGELATLFAGGAAPALHMSGELEGHKVESFAALVALLLRGGAEAP